MKRLLIACFALAAAACASNPAPTPAATPTAPSSAFSEQMISAGRYRVTYAPDKPASAQELKARALARAAQLTLDKGNEWFEIAGEIGGPNKTTLVIVMGKGETLAGGSSKTYDAKETLAAARKSR
jgi:hypothetical protein